MIPKTIHYAWFGSEVPDTLKKRITEWEKVLPDWKFKLWNENNYDIHKFKFSGEKYDKKQFGYIVDELRYDVLYQEGGFYLDMDEILEKDLTPLTKYKMVWGFMYDNCVSGGLIGSEAHEPFLKYLLDTYSGKINRDIYQDLNKVTSNPIITRTFLTKWPQMKLNGEKQVLSDGIVIFPKDYFCYPSRNKSANFAYHLFNNSWGNKNQGMRKIIKQTFKKMAPYLFSEISARRGYIKSFKDGVPRSHQ